MDPESCKSEFLHGFLGLSLMLELAKGNFLVGLLLSWEVFEFVPAVASHFALPQASLLDLERGRF